jgi:NTE family protein
LTTVNRSRLVRCRGCGTTTTAKNLHGIDPEYEGRDHHYDKRSAPHSSADRKPAAAHRKAKSTAALTGTILEPGALLLIVKAHCLKLPLGRYHARPHHPMQSKRLLHCTISRMTQLMSEADLHLRPRKSAGLPLPEHVALVLQGGGALGSYQAGVYGALHENAALIAGNPPERRVARLREFWDTVTQALPSFPIWPNHYVREALHLWSAGFVATMGVPGFFSPRLTPPWLALPGSCDALSFYDSAPLKDTLNALVDWDLLNDGPVRVAVGAVDIETGNFHYFDSRNERLDARHIMASGALPPGLPPIEIDGRYWWDGGLVSNTPLQHVLDTQDAPTIVFQVDLFPSQDVMPKTLMDAVAREKEIRFSSRTRQVSDALLKLRAERETIRKVLAKLPPELCADPDIQALKTMADEHPVTVLQLIYRANAWEGGARDFEFSARTMLEHWHAGEKAVEAVIDRSALVAQNILDGHTAAFDLGKKGR